jgi:hypothetical protein
MRLDNRAVAHIEAELASANPLGRCVLQHHDLAKGSVWAVVPEGQTGEVYNFRSGLHRNAAVARRSIPSGGVVEAVPSTEDKVTEWLMENLGRWPDALFLSESFLLRTADLERLGPSPARVLSSGDHVYLGVGHRDRRDAIAAAVNMTYEVPLGVGVLARLKSGRLLGLGDREALSASELASIVESLVVLMVGAYDGESVLLWVPSSASLPNIG